ncbi:MAG: sensor histidine kinase [Bacilli bacterium]|nr:sensor histidine kinase [Bacilli bacterium]MBO6285827.1 sensor histidine kinase [Bacilli bacterium]
MNFYDITIHDYLETIIEWVFEYYIIALALFWAAPKRSRFLLRLFLGLAIIIGVSYPLAIFYHVYGGNSWGRSFVYFLLFSLGVVHLGLCYRIEPMKLILASDFAYLVQNATYKLFITVFTSIVYLSGGTFNVSEVVYKVIYYSQFLVQIGLIYLFLIKPARKAVFEAPLPPIVIMVSFFTVLVSVVLSATQDIHIQKIAEDIYASPTASVYIIRLVGYIMSFLLDVSIVIMVFASGRSNSLRRDISDLQYLIQQSAKQYEISQQTIEAINIKCHDMKHRVNKIVGDSLPKDAIEDINETIAIYDALIDTGNKTLDVVLTEKNLACESSKIAFTKTADGKAVDFMSTGDIFCLFGNILDNAIEATKNVEDPSKRYINLSLNKIGEGITKIECSNYFVGGRDFENGLPLTTKNDKLNHGFGTKSIQEIVHRYHGDATFKTEGNIFTVSIIFYNVAPAN